MLISFYCKTLQNIMRILYTTVIWRQEDKDVHSIIKTDREEAYYIIIIIILSVSIVMSNIVIICTFINVFLRNNFDGFR